MPENRLFPPEGWRKSMPPTLPQLRQAILTGEILQGSVLRCDSAYTLTVSLGSLRGTICREDAIAPWVSGAERNISVLSKVGKEINFTVKEIETDARGEPVAILSRRNAQETAMEYFLNHLKPGMILACRVTHLAPFGAFLDIGCGIIAMLPIELTCVSRLSHPADRFQKGQKILAAVKTFDRTSRRITMTHRELLGTWLENASTFAVGETVQGIVRSVQEYGSFIELTPNLCGLAENRIDLTPGDRVSVYIKTIRPEGMKIKLQVIEKLPALKEPPELHYQITDGILEHWVYSPPNYEKEPVQTIFTASYP